MGKDMNKIWNESVSSKTSNIRKYFKIPGNMKGDMKSIIKDYKEAVNIFKCEMPKAIAFIPLIIEYFGEKADFIYQVIDVSYL